LCDKAKTFGFVKPLYGSDSRHNHFLFFKVNGVAVEPRCAGITEILMKDRTRCYKENIETVYINKKSDSS
jgi:hypothetical protein